MASNALNSGSRLLAILSALSDGGGERSMADGWIHVLRVSDDEDPHIAAVDAMQCTLAEVNTWATRLKELGAPEDLYAGTHKELKKAFLPMHANASIREMLGAPQSGAHLQTLRWSAWVLREFNESPVEDEELEALKEALAELAAELSKSSTPPGIKRVLARQAAAIRAALRLYMVAGVQPLKTAVDTAIGELATLNPDHRDTPDAAGAMQKMIAALKSAGEVCEKANAAIDLGSKLYSIGGQVSQLLGFTPPV